MKNIILSVLISISCNMSLAAAASSPPLSPRGVKSPLASRKGSPPRRALSSVVPRPTLVSASGAEDSESMPQQSPRSRVIFTDTSGQADIPKSPRKEKSQRARASTTPAHVVKYKTPEECDQDQVQKIIAQLGVLKNAVGEVYTSGSAEFIAERACIRIDFQCLMTQILEFLNRVCPRKDQFLLKITKEGVQEMTHIRLRCCFEYHPSLSITADVSYPTELDELMELYFKIQWQWFCGTATEKEAKVSHSVQPFLPLWVALERCFTLWKLYKELTGTVFTCA
jgi:hypothetical protein